MIHPWAMYYPTASPHVGTSEINAADVAYQYHTLYADGDIAHRPIHIHSVPWFSVWQGFTAISDSDGYTVDYIHDNRLI